MSTCATFPYRFPDDLAGDRHKHPYEQPASALAKQDITIEPLFQLRRNVFHAWHGHSLS